MKHRDNGQCIFNCDQQAKNNNNNYNKNSNNNNTIMVIITIAIVKILIINSLFRPVDFSAGCTTYAADFSITF